MRVKCDRCDEVVKNLEFALKRAADAEAKITALEKKLNVAIEALKYVELCDAYPDLSAFKYSEAYRLIRPKVREALSQIEES